MVYSRPDRLGCRKLLWLVGGYLIVINLLAFGMFALDKNAARQGSWRISEGTLLFSALAGGTLGAISAQQMLRHKTRKEPFRSLLYATALLQFGVIIYLCLNGLSLRP
jgi:uncharacterized membrane protein YsdA (DUF1294 family)